MSIEAHIIKDSISDTGIRLTTFQLRYPRFIHAELMTHRVFSRNASSSRAIPVKRAIEAIREAPARPEYWGLNKPGMQAAEEPEDITTLEHGHAVWMAACEAACTYAEQLADLGFHKQIVNRITEPFQYINVVVTSTQWSNWYALRAHPDAQPEIRILAEKMRECHMASDPISLKPGQWHLPYVTDKDTEDFIIYTAQFDKEEYDRMADTLKKVSAARCARVSYKTFDGKPSTIESDLSLCEKLIGGEPLHASPFEHQATPDHHTRAYDLETLRQEIIFRNPDKHGNLHGWCQYRKELDGECQ